MGVGSSKVKYEDLQYLEPTRQSRTPLEVPRVGLSGSADGGIGHAQEFGSQLFVRPPFCRTAGVRRRTAPPRNPSSIECMTKCGAAWKPPVIEALARSRKKNNDIPFSSLPSLSQGA